MCEVRNLKSELGSFQIFHPPRHYNRVTKTRQTHTPQNLETLNLKPVEICNAVASFTMRQITKHRCPSCDSQFDSHTGVLKHMNHPRSSCVNWFMTHQQQIPPTFTSAPLSPVFNETLPDFYTPSIDNDTTDIRLPEEVRDHFPGAGQTFGKSPGFMEVFDSDVHADMRKENIYYPFASKGEWEIASFLERCGLSMNWIDELLCLSKVCIDLHTRKIFLIQISDPGAFALIQDCKSSSEPN